nr:NADH dehydrogenase subunit 5, mitochondrial [Tanacetum cinerariifolium]
MLFLGDSPTDPAVVDDRMASFNGFDRHFVPAVLLNLTFYQGSVARSFLRFGYEVSFEALDKGAIEILGPYGISYTFRRLAKRISQLQSGFVVRRVRYDPWPPAWWGRLLRCGQDYGSTPSILKNLAYKAWRRHRSIKRRRSDFQSDAVEDFVTASERRRLKVDLEPSTRRHRHGFKVTTSRCSDDVGRGFCLTGWEDEVSFQDDVPSAVLLFFAFSSMGGSSE